MNKVEFLISRMAKIKVVCYGIGVIGKKVARLMLEKDWIQIVGAVDISPDLIGKDLGDELNLNKNLNVMISDSLNQIVKDDKPDIVVHTTSSHFKGVFNQLRELVNLGLNVVSTCEELSYPFKRNPKLADKLHRLAQEKNVTVLGTGINPGFLMDFFPIILTSPCETVERITVSRQINALNRRIPFQKKIGSGLSKEEFKELISSGKITGHVGLSESIYMVADALNWALDEIEISEVEPVIAKKMIRSEGFEVNLGEVCGVTQKAIGIQNNNERVVLDFKAYLGADNEFDMIEIKGKPNITQKIIPCINGDIGTISVVVNSINRVITAPPGLITMKDLPPPNYKANNNF